MNRLSVIFIAMLLAAGFETTHAQNGQSAAHGEKLLASAQHKATVDGDLKGAIEEYKRIVAGAGSNRALAAQALVRMAECHQKLGNAEAQKIYERIVREFGDQRESVAIARGRLGNSRTGTAATMALRKALSNPYVSSGESGVSADGRYVTYPAWDTGDLGVHDFATGTDRVLFKNAYDGNQFAQGSSMSKDQKHVAYAWFNGKDHYVLRVAALQASEPQPRTVLDNPDIDYIVPADWSPDGEWIVAQVFRKDHTAQIGLVSVTNGSLRVLKTMGWSGAEGLFLSPDGRYIGMDLVVDESNRDNRDVFVLAVDGSRETRAVTHPGRDLMMGWSPNGQQLLFATDRGATPALWALPMKNGTPSGTPVMVKSDIATSSLGVTRSGALFTVAQVGIRDVQVMSIDIERGKLLGAPSSAVRTVVGLNGEPEWSPDGKYLAYVSLRNPGGQGRRVIIITSVETGKTRELDIAMRYFGPIKWAPDSQSFLVKGQDLKGVQGIHQIDAQTGQNTRLPLEPGPCQASPEWSPDGKKIYYSGGVDCTGRDGSVLLERDMVTGREREIVRGSGPQLLRLSPDGRFFAGARGAVKDHAIVLIPVAGGEPTKLLPLTDGKSVASNGLSWAPDGRTLLVTVQSKNDREFLLVPADGGPARKLEGDIQGPLSGGLRVHPSGRQAAFVTGEYKAEVWVLENFLPPADKP